MTKKEEIEAILDVFTTEGWKFMIEDIKNHYDAISNIDNVNSVEELNNLKGQRHSLNWVINMKEWYQNALDNIDADV